jgi:predicted nucleic acid-binding protein
MTGIGIAPEKTARMKTAVTTRALVDSLDAAEAASVVGILAAAEIATSEAAMGECRTRAAELDGNLETAGWDIFEAIGKLNDDRQQAAQEILAELREALSSDEHVVGLAPALTSAQARAVRLLTKPVEAPKPPIVTPPITFPEKPLALTPVAQGKKIVGQGTRQDLSLADAKKCLAELDEQVKTGQKARISVSWVIEE